VPKRESPAEPSRPLRADAAQNRQQILDAARRTFAERGLGVRLDEIADVAGVGVGTVYRRFKDKDELIGVLFEQSMSEVVALAREVLEQDTDGTGLRRFLDEAFRRMAADRGLQQILTSAPTAAHDAFESSRAQLEPLIAELADQAHRAGRLRPDLGHGDLPVLQIMLSAAILSTLSTREDLWARYVTLVLDAIEIAPPSGQRLPASAPSSHEVASILEQWHRVSK
jgi:AcrR family transcriptional regulator